MLARGARTLPAVTGLSVIITTCGSTRRLSLKSQDTRPALAAHWSSQRTRWVLEPHPGVERVRIEIVIANEFRYLLGTDFSKQKRSAFPDAPAPEPELPHQTKPEKVRNCYLTRAHTFGG